MKVWPMIVRFFSGSSTPASASRNRFDASTVTSLMPEVRPERALDLLALVQPQQPVVDEHAGELIADRAMDERRRDRRIDAARQAADHARRCRPARGSFGSRSSTNAPGVQLGSASTDAEQKVRDQLAAARRVRDLGMELHAVDRLVAWRIAGDRHARARRGDDVSVAAARRRGRRGSSTPSSLRRARSRRTGRTARRPASCARPYSRRPALIDLAAREVRDELHAVADRQHRRDVEHRRLGRRRAVPVHRVRTAAQDDARSGFHSRIQSSASRRRVNLRVHARLAHAARDQLRELRSVIDDENA